MLCGWGGFHWFTGHLPSDIVIRNLEGGHVIALGHGGMGTRWWHSLNSKKSFRQALETGADGTEMDAQLTADGVIVAYHDAECCDGAIALQTLKGLRNCKGELLTADEVFGLGWPTGSVFSLDVKLHGTDAAHRQLFAERLKTLREQHPQFRILIESMSPEFLSILKGTEVSEGLYLYTENADVGLQTCLSSGLEGISIRSGFISAAQIEASQAEGIRVMLWGVGTRWDNRRAVLKHPDIIQSDRLHHLVSLAEQLNR